MPFKVVIKRDGSEAPFKLEKISNAIEKAFIADGSGLDHNSREIAEAVVLFLQKTNIVRPHIEAIQDMVETVLANLGYAGVALRYQKFREERRIVRGKLFVDGVGLEDYEEINSPRVFVEHSGKQIKWDMKIIQKKLVDDFQLSIETARTIASEVEKKIFTLNFPTVSSELIREFTNHVLREHGYHDLVLKEIRVGVPLRDIEALFFAGRENQEENNPERIRATIASHALKQFSLQSIFSREVAEAHSKGRFHIHGLGHPGALAAGAFSVRQIAKDGLSLHGLHTVSGPAKHARVLTTHMNTYLAHMRPYYFGPISLPYLNIFFAPFLEGLSEEEVLQEAQNLVFITAQNAFARGGEPLVVDFNLHSYIPQEIEHLEVVGVGGVLKGKNYADYLSLARSFAKAILLCIGKGDAEGKSFTYPVLTVHYRDQFRETVEEVDLLRIAAHVAAKNCKVTFIREEGETKSFSSLVHLSSSMWHHDHTKIEILRLNQMQTISINLPYLLLHRGADLSEISFSDLENELLAVLNLAVEAHEEKRTFLLQLSNQVDSPLREIQKKMSDQLPLVDFHSIKCCISFVGLEEFVLLAKGRNIESQEGALFAKDFLNLLRKSLKEVGLFSDLYEIEILPEPIAGYRFARLDAEHFQVESLYLQKLLEATRPSYSVGLRFVRDLPIMIDQKAKLLNLFSSCLGLQAPAFSPLFYHSLSSEQIMRLL